MRQRASRAGRGEAGPHCRRPWRGRDARRAAGVRGHSTIPPCRRLDRPKRRPRLQRRRHTTPRGAPRGALATSEIGRNSSFRLGEQIAYSAHGMNFRAGCGVLQLAPQVVHVHRNGIWVELLVDAVELFFENALRYDAALASEQVLQNRGFTTRELQWDAGNADVSANGIEDDIAGPKGGAERRSRTAQQRLRAGNELAHREWLHEIVVCARIEAENTVLNRITCGQDQNRYAISRRPQFSQQVQPVTVGPAKPLRTAGTVRTVRTQAAWRSARVITVYQTIGPSSGSSPRKWTIAPRGTLRPFPNSFTAEASTTCSPGLCTNAAKAISSAVLAPPERHDASKTPDRH